MIDEAPRVEIPRTTLHGVRISRDSSGDGYMNVCELLQGILGEPRPPQATGHLCHGQGSHGLCANRFCGFRILCAFVVRAVPPSLTRKFSRAVFRGRGCVVVFVVVFFSSLLHLLFPPRSQSLYLRLRSRSSVSSFQFVFAASVV